MTAEQDAAGQAAVAPILLRSLRSGCPDFERCRTRLPVLQRCAKKMKTSVLRSFFDGTCDGQTLATDLEGGVKRTSSNVVSHYIDDDITEDVPVTAHRLVAICDAFATGDLTDQMIQQLGFALMAADHFDWDCDTPDGERVAEVIDRWDSPEINYPITNATMTKFRHYLCTGEDLFSREDLAPDLTRKGHS